MQNISHAVMAQRNEPKDSRDDFPTPPRATRGLIEHVLESRSALAQMSCLEPAVLATWQRCSRNILAKSIALMHKITDSEKCGIF
jgi:hypothetical protein